MWLDTTSECFPGAEDYRQERAPPRNVRGKCPPGVPCPSPAPEDGPQEPPPPLRGPPRDPQRGTRDAPGEQWRCEIFLSSNCVLRKGGHPSMMRMVFARVYWMPSTAMDLTERFNRVMCPCAGLSLLPRTLMHLFVCLCVLFQFLNFIGVQPSSNAT